MSSSAALIGSAVGAVILLIWMFTSKPPKGSREAAFITTAETQIIGLNDLPPLCKLTDPGPFLVRTYRQSGNSHQEDRVFDTAQQALSAALSTFRRSRIDFVVVVAATSSEFSFRRPWHDHRGRAEGKKVGWIEIHQLVPAPQ